MWGKGRIKPGTMPKPPPKRKLGAFSTTKIRKLHKEIFAEGFRNK